MSEIKKELWKLSEKMEIEGKSSTIAGQINIMNRALDGRPGLDIADSVKKYADVASSGGGSYSSAFTSIPAISPNGRMTYACCYNPVDDKGTFNIIFENDSVSEGPPKSYGSTAILSQPATKIIITNAHVPTGSISFTASDDFDGIYLSSNKLTLSGDEIVPGDGKLYMADVDLMFGNTCTIKMYENLIN